VSGETEVRCGQCNELIAEPSNLPPEQRKPCPNCGATSRNFGVHISAALVIHTDVVAQAELSSAAEKVEKAAHDAGYELQWLKLPTTWMLRVFDRDGNFLAGSIQESPEDALLAVADAMLP
jgi:hypothetical protein